MSLTRVILILTVLLSLYCILLCLLMFPLAAIITLIGIAIAACKKRGQLWAHGTARWAEIDDVAHMLKGNGVIVGYIDNSAPRMPRINGLFDSAIPSDIACEQFLDAFNKKRSPALVRLNTAVHTAVFAPTGVGKGVSIVLPYGLTCPDSMVFLDYKGENFEITSAVRRKMGHIIVRLDPFNVCGPGGDTFNPFDFIRADDPFGLDHAKALVASMVIRTGEEKEPQWNDNAEIFIGALSAFVIQFAPAADRSLQTMRTIFANPKLMQKSIKLMCEAKEWEGMLARMGHSLTRFVDRELGSVLTTANRHTQFLDTIAVANNTRCSSFDPSDLIKNKMTIYLIIPAEHIGTQTALLRMWIGSLLNTCVRNGVQEKRKVRFIIDEAASLGKMDVINHAVDKYRGYGIRLLFLYQSIGQLTECFGPGKEQTLLSNVSQVFFGVNDNETAKYVSARIGKKTVIISSGGTSVTTSQQRSQSGSSSSSQFGTSDNWGQLGRELLQPDEIMTLPERIAITFTPGIPPLFTALIRHYEDGWLTPPDKPGAAVKAFIQAAFLLLTVGLVAMALTCAITDDHRSSRPVPVIEQWPDN